MTIVKSVLSSIPIYNMSFLPLPKKVASQFRSLLCNFIWGGDEGTRKMAWISWEGLCNHREEGGGGTLFPSTKPS